MSGAVKLGILQFSLIYLLLLIVLFIMKRSKIKKTSLLLVASVRMTVQLILVGFILQYVFANPTPLLTVAILFIMIAFSINQILSKNREINLKFKFIIGLSLSLSGLFVLFYFILAVARQNIFNPQYAIPLSGMIIGNAMTGLTLALKTFSETISLEKSKINTLINLGAKPIDILKPFINTSLETALLPTINSMLGMGIIFLPGMMTGQILSGTLPTTAIMYQISIMIAICTSVCLSVYFSLSLGSRTLFNQRNQLL